MSQADEFNEHPRMVHTMSFLGMLFFTCAVAIEYFDTVEGVTEGLAVFIAPDGRPHTWLTRRYGTFGPRRLDNFSGTSFTLKSGESLLGRAGILIHRGDAAAGRVGQRYQHYIESLP